MSQAKREVLFVGGPKDGARIILGELRPRYFVDVMNKQASHQTALPIYSTAMYELDTLMVSGEAFAYYRFEGMKSPEAFQQILQNYHPA